MGRREMKVSLCLVLLLGAMSAFAQQAPANNAAVVPPLVNFSGTLIDLNGKPLTSIVGVTFSLYNEQQALSPLWMETQNVTPDRYGRYSVQLRGKERSTVAITTTTISVRWLALAAAVSTRLSPWMPVAAN